MIVGPGGVGKTRLALEVASRWEFEGGASHFVTAGQEARAVAATRQVTSGRVLLVVDYAETRAGLEEMLEAVLADPGPIRVLLVARTLGEWWDRLIETSPPAVGALLTEAAPIQLSGQIAQDTPDDYLVAAAVRDFAHALNVAPPEQVTFEPPDRSVPVLTLHAAALVALLRFAGRPAATLHVVVESEIFDELLEHEARYWRRTASAAGLSDDGAVLKPVVAAAALLGAENIAEAAELVARVPDLADTPIGQRRAWARWLYGLYPAEADGRLGSLQPDVLAETHVVRQLAGAPDLARSCLRDLPEQQAEQALTVLARAWWAHHADAKRLISEALHADLSHLALPAAQVALQTRGEVGALLAAALQEAPASLDVLIEIAIALPYPSVILAPAGLAATWRVRASLPPDSEPAMLAGWNDRAGVMLSQLGRPAEALPPTQEAVAIYRELAQVNPDRYRPDLAASLNNFGVRFFELGRPADALPPTQEAVAIYRELTLGNPDRYRPDLAASLNNLGGIFSELGRLAEALSATEEAVAIRRELAATHPERYGPDLAASLSNLGGTLSALGRPADALPVTLEAVAIRRELTATSPDRYRPTLARSLSNLAASLSDVGRSAEALPITLEAVAIYRELAQVNPDRYRSDLAASLNNLGIWLSALGRPADALPPTEEAVIIYRELVQVNPGRYRPDLAASLSNLGVRLSELGRPADALPPTEEAVIIRRELVQVNPGRYRPDLAASLSNLGVWLSELGRPADALPAEQEAVTIRRELAAASPDRYRPDLPQSLFNLGVTLSALGRPADALPVTLEAVTIYRELAAASPDRYRPDLARSLSNLGIVFSELDRPADALPAQQEAATIRRKLEPATSVT